MIITATRRTLATLLATLDPFQDRHRGAHEGMRTTLAHTARMLRSLAR